MLLVIALTMFLFIIGATISTAVLTTTTTHQFKKIGQDLFYAAESGLQKAKAEAQDGDGPTVLNLPETVNMDEFKTTNNIDVTTTITRKSNVPLQYFVESKAIKDGQSRRLTSVLTSTPKLVPRPGANLLSYAFCSPSVNFYNSGSTNTDATKILSPDLDIVTPTGTSVGTVNNGTFLPMEFDPTIPQYNGEIVITDLAAFKSTYRSQPYAASVKVVKVDPPAGATGYSVDMFLINAEKVFMVSNATLAMYNTVIITSGNVYIAGEKKSASVFENKSDFTDGSFPVKPIASLYMNNSTIISDKLYLVAGSATFTFPPYSTPNSIINSEAYKSKVDVSVGQAVSNWENGTVGDIEYVWDLKDITEQVN